MADRIDGDLVELCIRAVLNCIPQFCIADGDAAVKAVRPIIAEATRRERDACAAIAEEREWAHRQDQTGDSAPAREASFIAWRIRARASQEADRG